MKGKKLSLVIFFMIIANVIFPIISFGDNEEIDLHSTNAIIENNLSSTSYGESEYDEYYENYSQDYKEYLNLSDEEKAKVSVIPRKYNVSIDDYYATKEMNKKNDGAVTRLAKNFLANNIEDLSQYDLREDLGSDTIRVENQGLLGDCWAFASLGALRTYLAKKGYLDGEGKTLDFSEYHLDYLTSTEYEEKGNHRELHEGGNFGDVKKYFARNDGPVYEEAFKYPDFSNIFNVVMPDVTDEDLQDLDEMQPEFYVHKTIEFPSISKIKENGVTKYFNNGIEIENQNNTTNIPDKIINIRNDIKQHIKTNGGLYTYLQWNTDFLKNNVSYYDDGTTERDSKNCHAVTIIGWDDNYPKENFNENMRPEQNGAYIALNSWGEEWGNNGYFYISYEDAYVEKSMSGYLDVDKTPKTVTYNFESQNAYNALKKAFEIYKDGMETNDELLTIEVPDILAYGLETLDFSECNLSDEDIEEIFKYEFPYLKYLNLNSNKITNITPLLKNKNLTSLFIGNNSKSGIDVTGISGLTELSSLSIGENQGITGLEEIYELKALKYLNMDNNNINNITGIENLTNLKTLSMNTNNVTNITALLNNKNLTSLYIGNNSKSGIDVTGISSLNNLVSLTIDENSGITGLEDIFDLKELTYLNINKNNIDNITGIEKLTNLQTLTMYLNNVTNITPLQNLNNLGFLDLHSNNVTDISKLQNLENLKTLVLSDNNVTSISSLQGLTQLKHLDLKNNKVDDISAIQNLENLTVLNLDGNNIIDIGSLQSLVKLDYLNLNNNNVTDIAVLQNLTNLQTLYLNNNKIEDISAIQNLENLTTLGLQNNKIEKRISDYNSNVEVKLPQIIIDSQNENSKVYSLSGLSFENCYSSDDENYVKIKDGNISNAKVKVKSGIAQNTEFIIRKDGVYTTEDEQFEYIIENDEITIKKYIGEESEITVPNIINDIPVKRIEEGCFDTIMLEKITIPSNIEYIGKTAFKNCKSLEKIIVEDTNNYFTSIDGILFDKDMNTLVCCPRACNSINLAVYTVPNSVRNIEENAFYGCNQIESIIIPNGVTKIKDSTFRLCKTLNSVSLPDEIDSIDSNAFYGCSKLKDINIPKSITKLGERAFYNCSDLEELYISSNVENIGDNCFQGCNNLTITTTLNSPIHTYARENGINVNIIDTELNLEVAYSNENPTKDDVEVTISANIAIQKPEGEDIVWSYVEGSDNKAIVATFTENINKEIKIYDLYGDEGTVIINITNIDHDKPTVTISTDKDKYYKGDTVNITAVFSEDVIDNTPEIIINDTSAIPLDKKSKTEYTYSFKIDNDNENQTIKIQNATDLAGNVMKDAECSFSVSPIELTGIRVTKEPDKKDYVEGEEFDESGMKITAEYSNESSKEVKGYEIIDGSNLTAGKTSVTISYTEGEVTETATQAITVAEKEKLDLKVAYSNENPTKDDVEVTISANIAIQKPEGEDIVWSYVEGSENKVIVAIFTENINKEIKIYDIYDNEETVIINITNIDHDKPTVTIRTDKDKYYKGDTVKITAEFSEAVKDNTPEIIINDTSAIPLDKKSKTEYTYSFKIDNDNENQTIKIQNATDLAGNVMKDAEFSFSVSPIELTGIRVTKEPDKKDYVEGEDFDESGMKVTAEYSNESSKEVEGYEIIDGSNLTVGKTSVTIRYTEKGVTKETTQTITVKKKIIPGDVIESGEIDQNDYMAILRHIAAQTDSTKQSWILSKEQQQLADVTKDGKIDLNDVIKLKRYIAAKNDANVAMAYPKWLNL